MSVYRDEYNQDRWVVMVRFQNWKGETKTLKKRGFLTKRAAKEWEIEFLNSKSRSLDMTFMSFVERYKEERMSRLKESTQVTKGYMIDTLILPAFGKIPLRDISAADVIAWQNDLMKHRDENGKAYASSYLKTVHNQLSAILNYAVKYYSLPENPARVAGNMGTDKHCRYSIWSQDEYHRFSEVMMEYPDAYYCFEVLYWTGIREGELLALTLGDVDFKRKEIRITKTYHRSKKTDIVTDPKTDESNRTVTIPQFLCEELMEYVEMNYDIKKSDRLFPVSKSFLERKMKTGSELAGLPRIRIHDLRHSHISLLILKGFNAVEIGKRVGHKSQEITFRYAHLFASRERSIADSLDEMRGDDDYVG